MKNNVYICIRVEICRKHLFSIFFSLQIKYILLTNQYLMNIINKHKYISTGVKPNEMICIIVSEIMLLIQNHCKLNVINNCTLFCTAILIAIIAHVAHWVSRQQMWNLWREKNGEETRFFFIFSLIFSEVLPLISVQSAIILHHLLAAFASTLPPSFILV